MPAPQIPSAVHRTGKPDGYLPSFGKISTIFCLPPTTSPRKLARSTSPLLSKVTSISTPGSSCGVIVMPCRVCGEQLAVELAHFFGDMLDDIHRRIAFDAVMVANIVEALLEALREFRHGGDWRIDGQANVATHAFRRALGKIDNLLAEQRGLADQRRRDALLLCFAEKACALFFVEIDEDRVGHWQP